MVKTPGSGGKVYICPPCFFFSHAATLFDPPMCQLGRFQRLCKGSVGVLFFVCLFS